jgi:hypothetical protein
MSAFRMIGATKRCRRNISSKRPLKHRLIRLVESLLARSFGGHIPSVQFLWFREVEQVLRILETKGYSATAALEGEAYLEEYIPVQI